MINDLVRERFDVVAAKRGGAEDPVPSVEGVDGVATTTLTPTSNSTPHTNGVHKYKSSEPSAVTPSASSSPVKREVTSETLSEVDDSGPPKKKRKASAEDDATLAARLQAEEDMRARPTRGAGTRKTAPTKKKKTPKKKTKSKVNADDDSDVEPSPRVVNRNTGFHVRTLTNILRASTDLTQKPLNLSPQLSNLLNGEAQLSRPQVTKKLWEHIKGNDLQDPDDKRYILCDDRMKEVFRQDKVHMFTMTKLVNQHMYNPDE